MSCSGSFSAVTAAFLNVTNAPALDANFTASCNGLTCSFNGSSSGGAPSSYGWSFGDGSSGTGVNATKTYAQAGSFNVTLTVGNGSSTNSETQTVVVSSPSQTVAEVEPNNSRTAPQVVTANPVTINGRLASTTDTDFFSVSLPAGATLRATLTPPAAADYDLQILNSSGTELARSELGTGAVDTATSTHTGTSAVTRLVRVVYYGGGAGNYTLRLQR
jgi:PKD repeat protein